jgi:WD40 repeat protein
VGLAFSPNAQLLACAGTDGDVWIWDYTTQTVIHQLKGIDGQEGFDEVFLMFSPDGQFLFREGLLNAMVCGWRLHDHTRISCINTRNICLTSTNGDVIATVSLDNILEVSTLSENNTLLTVEEHVKDMTSLSIFPDSSMLAVGMRNGNIQLWPL